LISCGVSMSIAGSSRPCSGSEHMFSHALETVKPNCSMHGERCGVGAIMMAYLHKAEWKRVKATLEKLGAPTNSRGLGVDKDEVVKALRMASTIRPERYTILNKLKLNSDACEKLAKATEVI
jgi:glycerol-1-phosphate dehydrogenase [NAD(P)+]